MLDRRKYYQIIPKKKVRLRIRHRTFYCKRKTKERRIYFGGTTQKPADDAKFRGGVIDTGAHKTVMGNKQAKAYCRKYGVKFKMKRSSRSFMFGNHIHKSLGRMVMYLPTTNGPVPFEVDIVAIDVPLLFGLDFMDRHQAIPNIVRNQFEAESWSIPITRKHGHLYVEWSYATNYTEGQLLKLHRQFHHPSTGKLMNILKRCNAEEVDEKTKSILEDIVKRCQPCQRNPSRKPQTFQVSIGNEDIQFNQEVFVDIMYLDKRPVIHIVDLQTRLNAAKFLRNISTQSVWKAFQECWANTYIGVPHIIRVDRGAQFTAAQWHKYVEKQGIQLKMSGNEAHNALGAGERYHAPLRIVYNKLKEQFKDEDSGYILSCAVYGLNVTMGPDGLVPITLAFGIHPNVDSTKRKATNEVRAKVQEKARKEMAKIIATQKVKRALNHNTPGSTDANYEPGHKVWIYREGEIGKPGKYTGPFEVIHVDDKHVYVKDSNHDLARPYSKTAVKLYHEPSDESDALMRVMHNTLTNICEEKLANVHRINLAEIINPRDPRADDDRMTDAKRKEIKGLLERGTFRIVLKEDIPKGANRLRARYVLSIKDSNTEKEVWKARYIIQGHRDLERDVLIRRSTTIQQKGIRLILAMAAIHGFKLWTTDVAQAYLQSQGQLSRESFIDNPADEFELDTNQALQLLRPLYGLSESGDHWYEELDRHHREDLEMKSLDSDHSLYYKIIDGHLAGLSGTYVNDCIQAGTEHFDELTNTTAMKYNVKPKAYGKGKIIGLEYEPLHDCTIVRQTHYINKLKPLPEEAGFKEYRSKRAQLGWIQNTRPDISFEVGYAAQVTEERFKAESRKLIKRINTVIEKLRKTAKTGMKYPKLDQESLRIVAYTDSSFANNYDLTSQLGYIVFLVDGKNNSAPVAYRSFKAKRVTRSVLAAETLAFSEGFDQAFALQHDIKQMSGKRIPITMLTDSQSLFDIITKSSYATEKRILIDIAAVTEAYREKDLSDIGLVASSDNLADGFTKSSKASTLLQTVKDGNLDIKVKQYVIRGNVAKQYRDVRG